MDKTYSHLKTEKSWYQFWEKGNYFTPEINPNGPPFSIILPPPNANADLHLGHVMYVVEDILIRYHRMLGDKTLWLPGADHAGFETQYVFEKELARAGKSRFNYDRFTLYQKILNFTQENQKIMEQQLRHLGFSLDWKRKKFTLDKDIIKVVYKTFKHLYDQGLIYRGTRLVNYCTFCGTSFSDLEAVATEKTSYLYFIKYPLKTKGSITVATTRPETMLGDTAVAVNPKDARFKSLIGKTAILPIVNRQIPIIADSLVDSKFATGAVKITPDHDETDQKIGKTHHLPSIQVIGTNGKMTKNTPPQFINLSVKQARKKVIEILKQKNLLVKITPRKITVKTCYKCKNILEPLPLPQWFIKVKPLAQKAAKAIKTNQVKIIPKRFTKHALNWLTSFHDWNISRQIVWGIQIPAWQCDICKKWTITGNGPPKSCPCGSKKLTQDPDTFDTWFSSGQWPYAVLKTSPVKSDYQTFYPTTVMETGYDILPWWVVRMIMLGLFETKKIPFKTIYLHGLVKDKYGRKMSKSKGNVINPMNMIEKYGADALRASLIYGSKPGNDLSINEDKIRAMRNFTNKLYNLTRFFLLYKANKKIPPFSKKLKLNSQDKKILVLLNKLVKKINTDFANYRFGLVLEEIYQFAWHEFADVYIEKIKPRLRNKQTTPLSITQHILETILKLLHPFMPFVTEELYNKIAKNKDPLIIAPWPKK